MTSLSHIMQEEREQATATQEDLLKLGCLELTLYTSKQTSVVTSSHNTFLDFPPVAISSMYDMYPQGVWCKYVHLTEVLHLIDLSCVLLFDLTANV